MHVHQLEPVRQGQITIPPASAHGSIAQRTSNASRTKPSQGAQPQYNGQLHTWRARQQPTRSTEWQRSAESTTRTTPQKSIEVDRARANRLIGQAMRSVTRRLTPETTRSAFLQRTEMERLQLLFLDDGGVDIAVAIWERSAERAENTGGRTVQLRGLYVRPDWQYCGLGTHLLEWLNHWAVSRGFDGMTVIAGLRFTTFFQSRGFRPHYRPDPHCLCLLKSLA